MKKKLLIGRQVEHINSCIQVFTPPPQRPKRKAEIPITVKEMAL
jgi:hypothetical protein